MFGGQIYVISSFGVARNPLFKNERDLRTFTNCINKYLSPVCNIYAYSHQVNQFQYLIKVKERQELERFYFEKQKSKKSKKNIAQDLYDKNGSEAPDSYLIFSQEASNCFNSYAKQFNFVHNRTGGLFGRRFSKHLVESEEEMNGWIERLNSSRKLIFFDKDWRVNDRVEVDFRGIKSCSLEYFENYDLEKMKCLFTNFAAFEIKELRGCFEILPPSRNNASNHRSLIEKYIKKYKKEPPW